MAYAIISLGGKQYRVQEGERLLVDRLPYGEGKAFHPDVLLLGGDGEAELSPKGVQVTAKVLGHPLGEKLRIGKYRPKTGYRKHTGFRARLSQVEITSIGKKTQTRAKAAEERPKPGATKKAPARKPATKKTMEKT